MIALKKLRSAMMCQLGAICLGLSACGGGGGSGTSTEVTPQANAPTGQANAPTGQANAPTGQANAPTGQANAPTGQGTATTASTSSTATTGSAGWTTIASESSSFSVSGTKEVRYGAGTKWTQKTVAGNAECTNEFFGSDPALGTEKTCQVLEGSAAASSMSSGTPTSTSPVASGSARDGVIAMDDPRVRWWVRADKTNQEIGGKFPWTGMQGSASSCDYDVIQNVAEPNAYQGRVILQRSNGYFQHRIWDGMCLWQGQRQRSAIHTSDLYSDASSIKFGRSYWFAFGGKFHPDMFSQTDPSIDRAIQILDFHHKAPSSAFSGNSPWSCWADNTGYRCQVIWNKNDSGVSSPTGEMNPGDGLAQAVTLVRDTSKDTTRPHFLAFRFKLSPGSDGWVESYRQIGVDGPIEKIGSWKVPTTYAGSDNLLFPKYGLHQWYPTLTGQPSRSVDMAGALIVEDMAGPVALTPETIFRSLTVAVPR
jgi:hypothetical protein